MHFGNLETEWRILFEKLLSDAKSPEQDGVLRNKQKYERKLR